VNVSAQAPLAKRAAGSPPKSAPRLQRKCDCESSGGGGSCSDCQEKHLQRRAAAEGPKGGVPGSVYETLRSPGQPLPPATQAFFEARFPVGSTAEAAPPALSRAEGLISEPGDAGEREADRIAEEALRTPADPRPRPGPGFDFSRVRVHVDDRAAESARSVQARAYTVGQDIVFAHGQYAPGTGAGRELLAHELAHTTQQAPRLSRAPLGPLDRQLPPHVPKAPSLRSAAAGPTPCATTGCPARIPGSAEDFIPGGSRGGQAVAADKPSVHLRKFAAAEAQQFLRGVHEVLVVPGAEMADKGISWGDCPQPPAGDPSAGCILVSTAVEQQAATFNQGQAPTVAGQAPEDWSFGIRRSLSWVHDQIQFRRSPTPRLPAGDAGAMWELQALHGWLAGWPVDYERAMSAATPKEQAAQVQKFIDFRVESRVLGVRGILKRLRCTLSCAEVDESITRVFGEVSSGWHREVRDALLFGLMDPKRRLDWPPRPRTPESMTFPAEPRPKMPPLYAPRTGFESEAGKSGENL
jgi:hypothetical protein